MKKLLYFLPFILVLTFISCNENEPTGPDLRCTDPEDGALILVNYPEGEDEFDVGDKIDIQYSIDVENTPGAVAFISKDNGRTWDKIVEGEMIPNTKTEGYECISYTWKIPSDFVTESNSKIKVKVSKYGDPTEKSVSEAFTIKP